MVDIPQEHQHLRSTIFLEIPEEKQKQLLHDSPQQQYPENDRIKDEKRFNYLGRMMQGTNVRHHFSQHGYIVPHLRSDLILGTKLRRM